MSDGDALLAAIIANPDADDPRLQYADWLEEQAGAVTCHICGGAGGWMSQYHGRAHPPHWCRCATCEGTGLEPDAVGYRVRGIRWMLANPQNSWVCLCHGSRTRCNPCTWLGDHIADIPRRADGETPYVVNRGFVSEVRCPTAAWLAHGPDIVARHPVARVVLSDREPWDLGDARLGVADRRWAWWREGGPQVYNRGTVPAPIFDVLTSRGLGVATFLTDVAALDALSAACVAWARAEAGRRAADAADGDDDDAEGDRDAE